MKIRGISYCADISVGTGTRRIVDEDSGNWFVTGAKSMHWRYVDIDRRDSVGWGKWHNVSHPGNKEGVVMKFYFLALATAVVVCVGCAYDGQQVLDKGGYTAPPAAMLQRPGPMVDGPGPGVMAMPSQPPAGAFSIKTTQVNFVAPRAMTIGWKTQGAFAENQIKATPSTYDFRQGSTYRLKLTNIADHEMLTLYPTLQVYPSHPTTDAYLSHNSIPIELTDEDFEQIESNNYVTKVIYLPDSKFQELAVAGVETLVSTRLEPGVDPVAAADRRGTILIVLRVGNKKLEVTGKDQNGAMLPGGVNQVAYQVLDGNKGQYAPPMPIGSAGGGFRGIPGPMVMGSMGRPGMPAMNPIAGMGGMPKWGMPMTATPIGLPGPAHLPLGGPASLRSHTIVNNTKVDIGKPVKRMLIEVDHSPGYRMPKPVNYIRYSEKHPTYSPGELAQPRFARP